MTKSTRDVSTCFVFKSSPEAFISSLVFKSSPPPAWERCSLTLFGLHLDFYLATPLEKRPNAGFSGDEIYLFF